MTLPPDLAAAEQALADVALAYPETIEDNPWGHRAFKVRGKAFVFLSGEHPQLSVTVKLPSSNSMALNFPFASPSGYGLGKSGWVTSVFAPGDDVPIALLAEWIAESFRAIAPKKLSAAVVESKPAVAAKKKPVAAKKKPVAAKKKPVAAKTKPVAAKKKPAVAAKKKPAAKKTSAKRR
jgi:predicted DNA-binding protein (MmcQ/YjbR family)